MFIGCPSGVRQGPIHGSLAGPSWVRHGFVGGPRGFRGGSIGGTSGLEVSPSKERCAMCEFLGQLSNFHVVNLMIF